MSFTAKDWSDGPSGNTPITAAELDRMEAGIVAGTSEVINSQAATAYTLALADAAKTVEFTSASASVLTVPSHFSVPLPVGSRVQVRRYNGSVAISPAASVTIRSYPANSTYLAGLYAEATLVKRADNEWILSGQLAEPGSAPPNAPVLTVTQAGFIEVSWANLSVVV